MMKKIFITMICGFVSLASVAQENNSLSRWYMQGMLGLANTGTETLNIGTLKNNLGFTGGAALGYQVNQNFGVSLQMQYARTHSIDDRGDAFGFNAVEPSLNAEFNLTNMICGYKESRKNFVNLYAGIAAAYTSALPDGYKINDMTDNFYALGFRAGLQYEHSMKNNWAFLVDAGINCFNDKFDHRTDGGLDSHLNLQIGFRKYFGYGKNRKRRTDMVDTHYNIIDQRDTVVIKEIEKVEAPKDMYSIFFTIDKIDIRPSEVSKIRAVAEFMKEHPEKCVFVFGYADRNTGTKRRNEWLATNRARVIAEQLINYYGIEEKRVIQYGQGDTVQPFPEEVFEKNRATICVIADFKR